MQQHTGRNRHRAILTCPGLLLILMITGCTGLQPGPGIVKGEKIILNYTCRVENQGVISSTDPLVAQDNTIQKSEVFTYPNLYEPEAITAGARRAPKDEQGIKLLELEIYYQLSQAVVGLAKEKAHHVAITSRVPEGLEETARYKSWPRTMTVPRIRKTSRYNHDRSFGRPPVVGEVRKNEGVDWTRVVSFDDRQVTYEILLKDGQQFDTYWGTATANVKGDTISVVIDAEPGMLMMWNGALGRVVNVTDTSIRVDFGHPFAGHELKCRVTAKSPDPESRKAPAQE